jgi:beta-galactosidase/beta-glucuronidase
VYQKTTLHDLPQTTLLAHSTAFFTLFLSSLSFPLSLFRQNNFNAIRTSHYPAHSSFYRLCDYYGMYVCDEANLETHGLKPMGRLAHDTGWEQAIVRRVTGMVQRDYNHACIITWSLGNEAGRGRNLIRARQRLLQLDTSRPICYESGMWRENTSKKRAEEGSVFMA